MGTSKSVKCKICGKKYVSKQALIDHIDKAHASTIPEGWNAARYENFLRTGKTEGRCVYCKKPTGWNDATGKYNRMCGSEECKKAARELANKNYIGVHGKPYSINDPEQQKKMIYGRKNSGKYIFIGEDGKEYVALYDSSYGKDFFEMLDTFLSWDGADIIAPSPHTYWYEYEGKKHFYIPDAYSTSLNLEIEIKDGGDNPNNHPKIQAVDKVKEQKKDAVMASLKGQVNYIKICNKDYTEFFKLLSELKQKDTCQLPKWESRLESITENHVNIAGDVVIEGTKQDEFILSPKFLNRQYKLHHPVLNYDDLIEYYRKKLFHKELSKHEEQRLYIELLSVREHLQKVLNGDSSDDERMNYEAKKALKEIDGFIAYVEEKNSALLEVVIQESSKIMPNMYRLSENNTNFSYSKDFRDVEYIVNSLNQKDKSKICNGAFKKSPYTKYRKVLMVNNSPVSFIEVYEMPQDKGVGYVVVATNQDNRGCGYSKQLVSEFLSSDESKQFDTIVWKYHEGNIASINFAKSMGFNNDSGDALYYYPAQSVTENSHNISAQNTVPIYIVSYNYGSVVGYGVKVVTGSIYNHTSLALTTNLEECYTFSRNPETYKSAKTNGFCKESLSYMIRRHGNPKIRVVAVYVPKSAYNKLKKNINEYIEKQSSTKFDYINFLYIFFNIPRESLDENNLNCSVFVDLILKKSGIDVTNGKPSNLVTPRDLAELTDYRGKTVQIYEGGASNYDFAVISKNVNDSYINLPYKEDTIMESIKSTIDNNYNKKGNIKLSTLSKKKITKPMLNQIKNKSKLIKHLDVDNDNCIGFFNGDEIACYIATEIKEDGTVWITALEVLPNYRGYGLGEQLLDFATHNLHATALGVSKNNEVAIRMYEKYGFKISNESRLEVNKGHKNNYLMYLHGKYDDISDTNIMESLLFNQKDLYYNKDKFDSGEINLCFITGHSGSGKSTMGRNLQNNATEHYELDDLHCIKDRFTMDDLKEYGDLIYSYFRGRGNKFYVTYDELVSSNTLGSKYEDILYSDFVHYAMSYAKSHKNRKFILEGIWLFCSGENGKPYFKPSEFKDYAFFIKGTSMIISKYRAAKRDANNSGGGFRSFSKQFFMNKWSSYLIDEKRVKEFRDYFSKLIKETHDDVPNTNIMESLYIEATKDDKIYHPVFIFLSYTGTAMAKVIKTYLKDPYAHSSLSFSTSLDNMVSFNKDGMVNENIWSEEWRKGADHIRYSLYTYMATSEEYAAIRRFVNQLLVKRKKLGYNILGLSNFMFGRGSDREDKFFCSEFVAAAIGAGNEKVLKAKPYMTTPYMLAKNDNFVFIKTGILKNYDPKKIDTIVAKKLEEGGFKNVIIK